MRWPLASGPINLGQLPANEPVILRQHKGSSTKFLGIMYASNSVDSKYILFLHKSTLNVIHKWFLLSHCHRRTWITEMWLSFVLGVLSAFQWELSSVPHPCTMPDCWVPPICALWLLNEPKIALETYTLGSHYNKVSFILSRPQPVLKGIVIVSCIPQSVCPSWMMVPL